MPRTLRAAAADTPQTPTPTPTPHLQQEEVEVAYSDDHDSLSHPQGPPPLPLYDAESALEISKDVADGFLILLSGGQNSANVIKEKRLEKGGKNSEGNYVAPQSQDSGGTISSQNSQDLNFAFAALTDGNVIEATFGVESCGGLKRAKTTSEVAFNNARAAKQAILEASLATPTNVNVNVHADSSRSVKQISVDTYIRCFEIIISYHLDLDSIGFITYCVKHHKVTDRAIRDLKKAFAALNEEISSYVLTS